MATQYASINSSPKKVIITGVTGQDGSYMADFLLKNTDCKIYGGVRRLSVKNHDNIEHLKEEERFELIDLDVSDPINVSGVVESIKPDYFINFAANSFVGTSWDMPVNHFQVNTMGVLYQLDAIRKYAPNCRYYNAGSSEEFGDVQITPQNELHPLRPRSPYGASKASARHIVKVFRESYGIYAVQGWLFNHESERRGEEFVTRKITKGVAKISGQLVNRKKVTPIFVGNIDSRRDWSHAKDFVRGVWLMLNQEIPDDYVLSSGETHSVKDFVTEAFKSAGVQGNWEIGSTLESACFKADGVILVEVDPKFFRPAEVDVLRGDYTKALLYLDWAPKIKFEELVRRMVQNDLYEV
jgi:GDPmannose 4,6-dehydratase